MAAAEPRVAVTAPPGYTGEERRGGGDERRGGGGGGVGCLTRLSPAALAVKFGARQRSPHCLLVKEHRVREGPGDTHPPQRTLFVLNVPPYCSAVSGVRGEGLRGVRLGAPGAGVGALGRPGGESLPLMCAVRCPPACRTRCPGSSPAVGPCSLWTSVTNRDRERRQKNARPNSSPTERQR